MSPFIIRTAEEWLALAASAPRRVSLYENLWHEREFACVLGDTSAAGAGHALRIAETVAEKRRVVFIDLQGTMHGFAERCRAAMPRNLLRVNIDLADLDPGDPDGFLKKLARTVADSGSRVCVVDSLFWLCEWYSRPGAARFFIMKFREMALNLGISLLVGATGRKRLGGKVPTAEFLPKGTAPYVDAIIPAPEADAAVQADTAGASAPAAPAPEALNAGPVPAPAGLPSDPEPGLPDLAAPADVCVLPPVFGEPYPSGPAGVSTLSAPCFRSAIRRKKRRK